MTRRTDGETRAYAEGYNACFNRFLDCDRAKRNLREAIDKVWITVVAVNNAVQEREENKWED